jgi:hypothetical protein
MKNILFFAVLFLFTTLTFAYRWPLDTNIVTRLFGVFDGQTVSHGIEIIGNNGSVSPIEEGELIFYSDSTCHGAVPSTLGTFAVLEHKGRLRSVYTHLDPASFNPEKLRYAGGDVLGNTGSSGYIPGDRLGLLIYDRELDQAVNPLLILPELQDRSVPVIKNVLLKSNTVEISIEDKTVLSPGSYRIYADVYDTAEKLPYLQTLPPYSLRLRIGTNTAAELVLSSIHLKDGTLVMGEEETPVNDVYIDGLGYSLGELHYRGGETKIELTAEDFSGNSTKKVYSLMLEGRTE